MPEELQATYCLYGKQSDMLASVDVWGNVCIVKEAAITHALERIAKMLALAAYGDVAVATTPLVAAEMKEIVVPGTLSKCLKIGRTLCSARDAGRDPIDATLEATSGWRLFDGTVARLETDDRDGYLFGTTHIQGTGDFQGQGWRFGSRMKPGLVAGRQSLGLQPGPGFAGTPGCGRGIYNSELRQGDRVVAIGMKGVEGFRTERGLELAGPRDFDFDIDYVPIEELVGKGSKDDHSIRLPVHGDSLEAGVGADAGRVLWLSHPEQWHYAANRRCLSPRASTSTRRTFGGRG